MTLEESQRLKACLEEAASIASPDPATSAAGVERLPSPLCQILLELEQLASWRCQEKFNNPLPNIPWVESPFFYEILAESDLDQKSRDLAIYYHENGYLILEFPDDKFEQLAADIIQKLEDRYGSGGQIINAWQFNESVKRIALNESIFSILRMLYRREPIAFQTLNFSRGTEQSVHHDSIHFGSVPERFMCGVWVALEDMDENNGPLFYYPTSHKLPSYDYLHVGVMAHDQSFVYQHCHLLDKLWQGLIRVNKLQRRLFCASKGSVLIWAANLLHGGALQLDKSRTRYSQVTHFYFEGCSYYTPLISDPFIGRIHFRNIQDIRTGMVQPHVYRNAEISTHLLDLLSGKVT